MKKFLLFATAAAVSMSAAAELTDVTPKAYNFDSGLEVPFVNTYEIEPTCAAWNPPFYFATKYPELYKDGLIMMIGPEMANGYDNFIAGTKVIDLGGQVGKVLCFGGVNSEAQSALKTRGFDIAIPQYENNAGYLIPMWHADPNVSDAMAGGVENACRIQIVLNVFENEPSQTATHFQPYLQTGSNGTLGDNECDHRAVYSADFCYNWGEAEADNNQIDWENASADDRQLYSTEEGDYFQGWGQGEAGYVWNPNRWMVYEFDVPFMNKGEEGAVESECPIKIKMEMPELNGATVFIKSVKFLMKDASEETIPFGTRRKTWKYMTVGGSVSVDNIMGVVNGLDVNVAGNAVTVTEAATIYTATGVKVAAVAAGETVELANGFYVAAAAGKSVKFVVK